MCYKYCEQQSQHSIQNCDEFKKFSAGEKYKIVKKTNACVNCLNPIHQSEQCRSKHSCFKCQKKHHTLLHNDEWANKKEKESTQVNLTKSEKRCVIGKSCRELL